MRGTMTRCTSTNDLRGERQTLVLALTGFIARAPKPVQHSFNHLLLLLDVAVQDGIHARYETRVCHCLLRWSLVRATQDESALLTMYDIRLCGSPPTAEKV